MAAILGWTAVAVSAACGYAVWRRGGGGGLTRLQCAGYALPAGVVLVGILAMALSAFAGGYTFATLLVPVALLGLACLAPAAGAAGAAQGRRAALGWGGRLALGLVAIEVGLVTAEALSAGALVDWDAWAIWGMKAKAFFVDGTVGGYLARGDELGFSWPDRPCLSSLFQAFVYTGAGRVDERAARLVHVALWVSLLSIFHASLRKRMDVDRAAVATAVLATLPNLTYQCSAGVANPVLGLYLFATLDVLEGWEQDLSVGRFVRGALMLAGAFLTRDEGVVLGTLALVCALGSPTLPGRRMALAGAGLWVLAAAPYALWMRLVSAQPHAPSGLGHLWPLAELPSRLVEHASDVPAILSGLAGELVRPTEQARTSPLEEQIGLALFWPLFAVSLLGLRRLRRIDPMGFRCALLAVGGLITYACGFVVFPYADFSELARHWLFAVDRHAIALAPVALRAAASVFGAAAEPEAGTHP